MGQTTRFERVRPRRVLIVHGDIIVRDRLERVLRRAGFETEATTSMEGCFEIGSMKLFDVALVGSTLPDADGIGLLRRMRLEPRMRNLPVVMISSTASSGVAVAAMESGADDHVREPYDNDELTARVRRIVARNAERLRSASERAYVLAGDFSGFPFHELVGFLHQNARSGTLTIATREAFGKVWFDAGQVVDATYGNLTGEPAFTAIFSCPGGGHFEFVNGDATGIRHTILTNTMGLLLEAAKSVDDRASPMAAATALPHHTPSTETGLFHGGGPVRRARELPSCAWSAAAKAVEDDINMAVLRVLTQKNLRQDLKSTGLDPRTLRTVVLAGDEDGAGFIAPLAPSMPASMAGSFLGSTAMAIAAALSVRGSDLVGTVDILHVPMGRIEAFGRLVPPGVDVVVFAPAKGDALSVPLADRIAAGEFIRRVGCGVVVCVGDASSESVVSSLLGQAGWDGLFVRIDTDCGIIPDARELLGKVFAGVAGEVPSTAERGRP